MTVARLSERFELRAKAMTDVFDRFWYEKLYIDLRHQINWEVDTRACQVLLNEVYRDRQIRSTMRRAISGSRYQWQS